ncbi:hypothetical protein Q5752_002719 [Cryptotrichosporon argae]
MDGSTTAMTTDPLLVAPAPLSPAQLPSPASPPPDTPFSSEISALPNSAAGGGDDVDMELDLAPLPIAFDPDAPAPVVELAAEDDELAVQKRAEEKQGTDQGDHAATAQGQDGEALTDVLRRLQRDEVTEGAAKVIEVDPASTELADEANCLEQRLSPSPLLAISSLPTELNLEPAAPLPPSAESSAAAQRRVDEARRRAAGKRKGKAADAAAAEDQPTTLGKRQSRATQRRRDAANESDVVRAEGGAQSGDDSRSLSDSEGPGRARYKRVKGIDGKHIRTATRRHKQADKQLGIERNGNAPPEKVVPRGKFLNEQKMREQLRGKTREFQLGTCQRPRYNRFHRCTQCVSKIAGDVCRFRGYRLFPIDPSTGDICGDPWFPSTELEGGMTSLPRHFNVELDTDHMQRIERTVAPFLLPLITSEVRHAVKPGAIKRVVDAAKHRSVCDFCSSTIFAGFFFCKKCGRDYCLECERFFSDSTSDMLNSPWPLPDAARPRLHRCVLPPKPEDATKLKSQPPRSAQPVNHDRARQASSPLSDAPPSNTSTPRAVRLEAPLSSSQYASQPAATSQGEANSLSAVLPSRDPTPPAPAVPLGPAESDMPVDMIGHGRGRGSAQFFAHVRPDLQATSRFSTADLEAHWLGLVDYVMDLPGALQDHLAAVGMSSEHLEQISPDLAAAVQAHHRPPAPDTPAQPDLEKLYTTRTHAEAVIADPAGLEAHARAFMRLSTNQLDNATFDAIWARGEPLVVDDIAERFKQPWTPETFIERFGEQQCYVVDCQTDKSELTVVGEFFKQFQDPAARSQANRVLKLKDWPATDDFQSAYPDLYNDFCDALPVPDFTRRDGVLNLYSHFPPGPTRPDIGPKMYNAFVSLVASTRLHMDVADAVNVMLYASPRADSSPGCAVWDLYRAEDADAIRTFLRDKFGGDSKAHKFTDPIHSQHFYLDADLRKELWEKHQVSSYRVYQYPGQAVFIPAGCAHQVCNLADCIKIALDFVSPHNVKRCQQLVEDFRTENFALSWKEDVLQFCNIMWYAWLNVRETRERRKVEYVDRVLAAERQAAQDARAMTLSHAISSVRDEPQPHGAASIELPSAADASALQQIHSSSPTGVEHSAKRMLALRLLDAVFALPDASYLGITRMPPTPPPQPEPPKLEDKPEDEAKSAAPPERAKPRYSEAIRKKHVPDHLALNVLVNEMNEKNDADDDVHVEPMTLDLRALSKRPKKSRHKAAQDEAIEVDKVGQEQEPPERDPHDVGNEADDQGDSEIQWDTLGAVDMDYLDSSAMAALEDGDGGVDGEGERRAEQEMEQEQDNEELRRQLGGLYDPDYAAAEVEGAVAEVGRATVEAGTE